MAQTDGEIVSGERQPGLRGDETDGTNGSGGVEPSQEMEPQGYSWGKLFRDLLETLLLAVVLFVGVRATLQNTRVDGHSMEPSLHHGQYLMVNKLIYRFSQVHRGDIVVFHSPQDGQRALIKRVIGLPGEEVAIRGGQVYINNIPLTEPYLAPNHSASNWGPKLLGPGEFMAMGDNRDNSNDSRHFGPVSETQIIGKAWFSLWPAKYGFSLPHYNYANLAN